MESDLKDVERAPCLDRLPAELVITEFAGPVVVLPVLGPLRGPSQVMLPVVGHGLGVLPALTGHLL